MASTKKTARTVTAELQPDDALTTEISAAEAGPEPIDAAALCPSCGELLAWHEQPCAAPGNEVAEPGPAVIFRPAATSFAYDLGQPVQPATQPRAYRVIWRGQVKERHPGTGWLHRVNVYRLNDGHWDCYHEDDLQAA